MISEETALELLEQLLILNRNLEEFNELFAQKPSRVPRPHPGDLKEDWVDCDEDNEPSEKKPKPKEPGPQPERKKLFDFEPVMSVGPTIIATDDKGREKEQPAYFYIGQPQYDPTKPIPECFPAFGTEDCKDPDTCAFRNECQEHPENAELQEPKGGFTPRTEKTIIQPAVFDDSELAESDSQNTDEEESGPDTEEDAEAEMDTLRAEQECDDEEMRMAEPTDSSVEDFNETHGDDADTKESEKSDAPGEEWKPYVGEDGPTSLDCNRADEEISKPENEAALEDPEKPDKKISKKLEGYLELGKHIKELQNAEVIEDNSE